jgi:hypothetical protein
LTSPGWPWASARTTRRCLHDPPSNTIETRARALKVGVTDMLDEDRRRYFNHAARGGEFDGRPESEHEHLDACISQYAGLVCWWNGRNDASSASTWDPPRRSVCHGLRGRDDPIGDGCGCFARLLRSGRPERVSGSRRAPGPRGCTTPGTSDARHAQCAPAHPAEPMGSPRRRTPGRSASPSVATRRVVLPFLSVC